MEKNNTLFSAPLSRLREILKAIDSKNKLFVKQMIHQKNRPRDALFLVVCWVKIDRMKTGQAVVECNDKKKKKRKKKRTKQ